MRVPGLRWAAAAGAIGLILPACGHESPANASPTVAIARTPDGVAIAGATIVLFTATASDANGDALTLTWDLGDGQTASGASVVHVYARTGVFPVGLTVSDGRGGVTVVGSSITVGDLAGNWLISTDAVGIYERGYVITQAGSVLGGRPYSIPDHGCLGDIQGLVTSPRAVSFHFRACDGNDVVVQGTATSDLLQIQATYLHPLRNGPASMVLTRGGSS
jgi:hypothetical protein